jgi:hypothetical protein
VGAENAVTSCDLGIFVDQPAQAIDPHDAHVGAVGGTAVSGEACPSAWRIDHAGAARPPAFAAPHDDHGHTILSDGRFVRATVQGDAWFEGATFQRARRLGPVLVRKGLVLERGGPRGSKPRVVSVRRADVAGLTVAGVDLCACQFVGAHHLDQLRVEESDFPATPKGWR